MVERRTPQGEERMAGATPATPQQFVVLVTNNDGGSPAVICASLEEAKQAGLS